LQLTEQQVSRLNGQRATAAFQEAFVQAIADGFVDDAEYAHLENIARAINSSTPQMCRTFLLQESEGVLRTLFSTITSDQRIVADEWQRFLLTAARLGVAQDELMRLVQPQAMLLLEHTLADAKADEQLSPHEEQTLLWMLQTFAPTQNVTSYVYTQLQELKIFTDIAAGRLPSLTGPVGIEAKAGEIVHYVENALYESTKFLKSGPRADRHPGRAIITDTRLVFSSASKSVSVSLRNILECNLGAGCIELRTTSKGGGIYYFQVNPRLAHAVLRAAVGRANQTIVSSEADRSRYIPRDVRQRVWQRYGGRCVECQSEQYLEFDHIIPVARGGNNAENNVQLLCRNCNLKKSDHI
jgi:hypothetical protein